MKIKNIVALIVSVVLIWCVASVVRPFWSKHWLGKDMQIAAIYGTKHSIEDTRDFLNRKMEEVGRHFSGEDFVIERDENNRVTISITYRDEIRMFGLSFKPLRLKVERNALEIKEMF
jgi:hypothetical protein